MGMTEQALEPLFSLKEAVRRFLPEGVSPKALRTEARRGRLRLTRIAGKDFVSESDIREMFQLCRDTQKPRASSSEPVKAENPYGSSSIADRKRAQAALKETLKGLKPSSARTSLANTPSPARLAHLPSSTSRTS